MSGSLCPVKPTKRTLPSFFAFSSASAAPPLRMNRSGSFWKLTPCICQRSRWSVCSLRRLQTDHLDLWQIHGVSFQNDPDLFIRKGGAAEALLKAKKDAWYVLWALPDIRIRTFTWRC